MKREALEPGRTLPSAAPTPQATQYMAEIRAGRASHYSRNSTGPSGRPKLAVEGDSRVECAIQPPLLLTPILLIASVCSASRVSGTYVGHGANFTEMLQLTQTNNGQISGVISSITLKDDGTVKSEQAQVTGAVDADQMTLKFGSELLSFVFGRSLSGTITGSTIKLQIVDSKGNLATCIFVRGTTADFKAYADQLRSKGAGMRGAPS